MRKAIVIIGLILVVLLGVTELYIQTDHFADVIRPLVIGPLQEVLGKDAHIGWIRANFIPLYLEARDIYIPDARGKPVIAIHKVKVYINPLPLLYKTVRLPSIVVLEPRIMAERSPEGDINLLPVIDRIRTNIERMRSSPSSGFDLMLKSITLSQGSVSFLNTATGSRASLTDFTINVKISLKQDDFSVRVRRAQLHAAAPAYPELSGELTASARYEQHRFHIETVSLKTVDMTVSLSGTVGTQPDPELDLHVSARTGPETLGRLAGLLKKLRKQPKASFDASASVRGTLGSPLVDGSVQLAGIGYEGLVLKEAALAFDYRDRRLTATGEKWKLIRGDEAVVVDSVHADIVRSERGLDIRKFAIQAGDLSVEASGRADPQRGYDAVLSVVSNGPGRTLAVLTAAPFAGPVSVKGQLTGAITAPLVDGTFSAGPVTVRGIPFDSANGRIEYRDAKVSVLSADIHQRDARYLFNGSADWSKKEVFFDARLKVIHADVRSIVAIFYEPLPLYFPATGDLSFSGTAQNFTGTGRVLVDAGSAYGETFSKGSVSATLTKDRISFPEVLVQKGSGQVRGTGWIGFNGTYQATVTSNGVRLGQVDLIAPAPVDGPFDLSIESSGNFSQPQVDASLKTNEFLFNQTRLGGFSAGLQIRNGVLTCSARLADDRGTFAGRMTLARPYAWSTRATFKADAVDPFQVLGKKDLTGSMNMTIGGSLTVHGNGADVGSFGGRMAIDRLSLMIGDYRIDNDQTASIVLDGNRLSIAALTMTGPATKFSVTGSTRFMHDVDLTLHGTANLSLIRPLIRDLEYTNGTADLRLTIRDTWQKPEINGELVVRNGEIKIRDIPQKFSALNGKLNFDRRRVVIESLIGEFGGGTLKASGTAELSGTTIEMFSTHGAFENVTIHYPEGLTATLSGDLSYSGDQDEQLLGGDVLIKKARYDRRVDWKSMLVDIGKGLQKRKAETGWIADTQINVRFYGKENILLQNNLAKVPLDVDMYLRGTVNRPQLLGRLEARSGSVYFRQNEFKILHASADFVDPVRINPVLDIQAEIMVRDYLVRLSVSGTADRAVVTLLSSPHLSDSDILTLLALGKTSTELKGKESSVGMSEAAAFATGQVQDIFESHARSLTGLDRFQIDPYVSSQRDTSVPRVTVGKELVQNKVVVTYSQNIGVSSAEQVFRIEYLLNKNFSLVGERNEIGNTGADLKYRFEFR
jgi:autotransporter translocation and assembly factor TamB